MQVRIEEKRAIRRATASLRSGGVIHVKVPLHWPDATKNKVIEDLVSRLRDKDIREKALLERHASRQTRLTLQTDAELADFVQQVNRDTFQVPLGKIQIGYARYNHLAQVNLRTKTMTVSRYCLNEAPADALRYLIIHELAHYFQAGHGPAFWSLVARHMPDHRLQSRIIKAFHHQAVIREEDEKRQQEQGQG